jgi:SprT-like family
MNRRTVSLPLQGRQLTLPFDRDLSCLSDLLADLSGKTVSLTVTDNTTSMLSAAKKNGHIAVRLHRIFLHAGDEVLMAVAGFIAGRKDCRPLIRGFIRKNGPFPEQHASRRMALKPHGTVHCLSDIFDRLNREYFDNSITAGITWGNNRRGRRPRRITLGTYCSATNIVRINPLLDRRSVPSYYVEFIVYHEMLHADLLAETAAGRRRLHAKEFRMRERQFAAYEKAVVWEKKHL